MNLPLLDCQSASMSSNSLPTSNACWNQLTVAKEWIHDAYLAIELVVWFRSSLNRVRAPNAPAAAMIAPSQ